MLRLAHPAPAGKDPPKRRKGTHAPSLSLTDDEARHLRASVRNIARTFGGVGKLAAALGVDRITLTRKRAPSSALAVALWRLTGTPVEELLGGKLAVVPGGAP